MEDNNNMTLPLEEADNNITESPVSSVEYTDDNIRHLDDMEHIRVRSGMYIGRLGDGSQNDDGIYVLLKEVMDNSIDEFKMGAGKRIEVTIEDSLRVSVRDYRNLMERCPNLKEVVPLKSIASFLGVTPETISRIRRKLEI